jgi:glycosyltransferase involved in cell wall biosynthesis
MKFPYFDRLKPLLGLTKQKAAKIRGRFAMQHWEPYSHLFLKNDGAPWVLSGEMKSLGQICETLNIPVANPAWIPDAQQQAVFYASRYELLGSRPWLYNKNRFATAYFHGKPGTGEPIFDEMYETLKQAHPYLHRIQVSHTEMHDVVLNAGVDPKKVFLIPIGIDTDIFQMQTFDSKQVARDRFDIPNSSFVVGSFQKDGSGWEEGNEPKLIKGPDIFLAVIKILKQKNPGLFVLLTGPARGYVKCGLQEMNIPYKHIQFENYHDVNSVYQALDLYIVASRQEGGPKAILESMAAGVPLVTTRVGQAMDLVKHGVNAWMAEVDDVEELAHWSIAAIRQDPVDKQTMLVSARQTAEQNSYTAQVPLWEEFMEGFVEMQG